MADWRELITSGLQPEDPLWLSPTTAGPYDGARPWCNEKGQYHGIRVLRHTRPSPMLLCAFGAGLILEEASSRLIIWQHLINIISSTLPKSWRGTGLYHVCQTARAEMLGRADHRELVHLHRWRMTCPLVMIENEQARPMKAFPRTSLVRASPPLTSPAVRLLVRLLLLFLFSSLAFTPSAFCSSKVPTDPWRLSSTATPTPGPGTPGFNASASLLVHDTDLPAVPDQKAPGLSSGSGAPCLK